MYLLPAASQPDEGHKGHKERASTRAHGGVGRVWPGEVYDWTDRTWPRCSGTTRDLFIPPIQEPGQPANLTTQAQAFSHKNGLETGYWTLEIVPLLPAAPCRR